MANLSDSSQARVQHHGDGGELFVILLKNFLLKIVTLGIYHFWGKTRVRRYLWSQTSFDGERLQYTGKGGELFLGFLKAMVIIYGSIFAFVFLVQYLQRTNQTLTAIAIFVFMISFYVLIGVGIYSARRYTLSRTIFRGVRFGQSGSAIRYGMKFVAYLFLTMVTLGVYTPFMVNKLNHYKYSNTWFGNKQASYDGTGGAMLGRYLLAYLLTLPTLGLIWIWYKTAEWRYVAEHIHYENMNFKMNVSGGAVFRLLLTNLLIMLLTLGLGFAWVLIRSVNFTAQHLSIEGQPDYEAISQSTESMPRTGEGLVEAFDMGGI